jgi:ATP-dependent DNA helicase PIF1
LDDALVTEKIFGGKIVVLGVDFCQILPVVPKGGREDIISVSLFRLHLWQHVVILRLHINMQVMTANFEKQRKFAKCVLNVGDGSFLAIAEEGVDRDWIKVPSHMRLRAEDCNLRGLIQTIYPDHQRHSGDAMYFMQHNILAPKNIAVGEVNNAILELIFEELHTYLAQIL